MSIADFAETAETAARKKVLKKIVFSKSSDSEIIKSVGSMKLIHGEDMLQIESFFSDGKARHLNIPADEISAEIEKISVNYSQINLLSTAGDCEVKKSKNGRVTLIGVQKLNDKMKSGDENTFDKIDPVIHNREKNYILSGKEPFLYGLGISSAEGRVHDKWKPKFRQINRFLENIRDVEHNLPSEGELVICDLCCGKSYLSFAVYYYFTVIRGREVKMTGVDLKADVIEYCQKLSEKLGFGGLEFIAANIDSYEPEKKPDIVLSLHACDTATDIVLNAAIRWNTPVILSTPCCHHELNHKINCPDLKFITRYSMLRQKLCDAATDALRLANLEANGYETEALELIDPEDTPKNILLRAVKKSRFDKCSPEAVQLQKIYNQSKAYLLNGGLSK